MNRFVRCENCNKRLYGNDAVVVDNLSRVDELFCSNRCIKQYYGEVLGSKLATKPITVNQYWKSMKAEIISAKAVRFIDTYSFRHVMLAEDIDYCRIERNDQKLEYFVKLRNPLYVVGVDHDTYSLLLKTMMKECIDPSTEKISFKRIKKGLKEIKFSDIDGKENTVLVESIHGLSIQKNDKKLRYFANISKPGLYLVELNFENYNILLAALKAVANSKELENGKNKEKKEKK